MENMSGDTLEKIVVAIGMVIFALTAIILVIRMSARASEKATEVLKIYAERGEEPPQSVIDALTTAITGSASNPKGPPTPRTRAQHFSNFASCSVFAIGAAGIAWWRAPEPGEDPGAFMILAIVAALIFTAGAVSHLVTAFHIRDGQ